MMSPTGTASFAHLYGFLTEAMRMQHVYQPVMPKTLLENAGKASTHEIATAILLY